MQNDEIVIVPQPVRVEPLEGFFSLSVAAEVVADDDEGVRKVAKQAVEVLRAAGIDLSSGAGSGSVRQQIVFTKTNVDRDLGDEGYELTVDPQRITIRAPHAAGLFYGVQTLRQLLPVQVDVAKRRAARVGAMRIWDRPRFGYRGLLLDSARHMQSVEFIRRTIDRLAYHKLNRLHWHITDDQGWRFEMPKWPRLTEVGAWREAPDSPTHRYGGFYTEQQIREIVAYAAERFITVIPEVDMPGHMTAALASYPELACFPRDFKVETNWGIFEDVLCPGKPQTYRFVEDVLARVMELFPSKVIHIGGDECPRTRWQQCPHCQETVRRERLGSAEALQPMFTRHLADFLRTNGRRLMGWNEILHGGDLPDDVIVHQWNEEHVAAAAAREGKNVVASFHRFCYLDYKPEKLPMEKMYSYEPVPADLGEREASKILGPQANLWTERRPDDAACDDYIWPRLCAMAEVAWSEKQSRNWEDFRRRLETAHLARLAVLGLGPDVPPEQVLQSLRMWL